MSEDSTKVHNQAAGSPQAPDAKVSFGKPIVLIAATIGIFFISQVAVSVVVVVIGLLFGLNEQDISDFVTDNTTGQFVVIAGVELLTVLLVWLIMRRYVKKPLKVIGLAKPNIRHIKWLLAGILLFYAAVIVISVILYSLVPQIDLEQQQQLGFKDDSQGLALIPIFISLVILAPIAEEILVRGYLYTGLRRHLQYVPAALIVSSLFAAAHLQLHGDAPPLWTAAVNTFVLSLVLVYLREKTGSLWPAIGLHIVNNAVAFSVRFIFN